MFMSIILNYVQFLICKYCQIFVCFPTLHPTLLCLLLCERDKVASWIALVLSLSL